MRLSRCGHPSGVVSAKLLTGAVTEPQFAEELDFSELSPSQTGLSLVDRARDEASAAMDGYAAGNDAAFGDVYDALAPRLYGYLLRQTRDPGRAEDLLQQTMLQIHAARGRFFRGAEVVPWAFAIARRLLIDSYRRRRREAKFVSEGVPEAAAAPGPAGMLDHK